MICQSCGGVIGKECWNPQECAEISAAIAARPEAQVFPLAETIRTARERAGLSLSRGAAAAGMTKSHLWEIEDGRAANPTVKSLVAVADALGASPTEFFLAAEHTVRLGMEAKSQTPASVGEPQPKDTK